jgi:hypothetical protein
MSRNICDFNDYALYTDNSAFVAIAENWAQFDICGLKSVLMGRL